MVPGGRVSPGRISKPMAWVYLTDKDAATAFVEHEWQALTASARDSGAGDVVEKAIARVVARVRMHVASCDRNALGPAGTIPEELVSSALALLVEEMATSIPASAVTLDEGRQRRISEAKVELKAVMNCELSVEQPTAPDPNGPTPDNGWYGGEDYVDFNGIR
jgi:hypothetical protein